MMTNQQAQYEAIAQMAPNLHEYNRGVMAMLGREREAAAHKYASRTVEQLREERDALTPQGEGFDAILNPLPPDAAAKHKELREAAARQNKLWHPMQALITEARQALGME